MSVVNFSQPSKGNVTSNEAALSIINNGDGDGITSESKNHVGVRAISHGTSAAVSGAADTAVGVIGQCNGNDAGVWGVSYGTGNAVHGTDTANGVYGESRGDGVGVVGETGLPQSTLLLDGTVFLGGGPGVKGLSHHTGNAVEGIADKAIGVYGESKGDNAGVVGVSQHREGVYGTTSSNTHAAVAGIQLNTNPSGFPAGVYGESKGNGPGIVGKGNGNIATANIAGYFDGNVEVTGDVKLVGGGQDCAEDFDIASKENIEPGTVMVLNESGALQPSYQEYDKKVAGIISGAGGFKPAIILNRQEQKESQATNGRNKHNGRLPVALLGKAYCKVDARHFSIEIGDLLTTSRTKGHAMKAEDPYNAFGAVIGKALGSIKQGMGMIPVLVALQ